MNTKTTLTLILSYFLLFFCFSCSSDNEELASSEKQIKEFKVNSVLGTINEEQKTISITLPHATDLTKLIPEFKLSEKATSSPTSKAVIDFTNPVIYTVTAEDKTKITYQVTVLLEVPDKVNFLDFTMNGVTADIDHTNKTIRITLPRLTDVTHLTPSFVVEEGSSVVPAIDEPQDFTNPVVYTITDEKGKKNSYTVSVVIEKNDEALITSIQSIEGAKLSEMSTSNGGHNIDIKVEYGSDLTSLKPIVTLSSGARITPETPQDFSNPVVYTVTAESGRQVQYTFTISLNEAPAIGIHSMHMLGSWVGASDAEDMRSYGVIDRENKTIKFNIPTDDSWDVKSLKPYYIAHYGTQISPNSEYVNFTNPVIYTLTGQDGKTEEYTVSVTKKPYEAIYLSNVSNKRPSVGEILTLTGIFAPSGGHKVQFIHSSATRPTAEAKVISESATEIKVEVPERLGGTWLYHIRIEVDNMTQLRENFVYY